MDAQLQLESADHLDARQFQIAVKRLADSLLYGTVRSSFKGAGLEYAESRLYAPGDPIKSIDWRVTARTQKYFVKEYDAPKQMAAWLLVDASASMTLSSTAHSKYALAVQLAGGIALACLQQIHPVGIVGVGQQRGYRPASLSRNRVLQWLHALRHYRVDVRVDVGRQIAELAPHLLQRCLIIVLSDLNDPAALAAIKALAQRHDCVVLQLRDPIEEGMRSTGFLRAREAETGRGFVTRGRRLGGNQADIERQLKRARVDHLVLRTDQPFEQRLRYFFKSRGVLGRGTR